MEGLNFEGKKLTVGYNKNISKVLFEITCFKDKELRSKL